MMILKRLEIAETRFEEIECSVDDVKSSACDDDDDDVEVFVLTDSLTVHFIERVLLLTVNRAYEEMNEDVSSILELFIYVWFFERSDFFYTFDSLNVIDLMRLILIEKKSSRSWSSSENYWTDCSDFYWKRSD